MRQVYIVATLAILAAVGSIVQAGPSVYAVSPRPVKGQAGAVSVVLSTIDSTGKVTDLGPIIPTVDRIVFQNMIRSSGLCPRGLVYNYAVNQPDQRQASVYFFSIQRKTARQVRVPSILAANKQALGGIYFDAQNLYGMYGNTILYMDPGNGTILKTLKLWPDKLACKPAQRLNYDLANKQLLAYCSTEDEHGNTCDHIIRIDPATGKVNFPTTCLQGGDSNPHVSYFAAYDAETAVTVSLSDNGAEVILANLGNSTWGPVEVTADTLANSPAEWMRPDLTVWDYNTGLLWFMGRGPVIGRQYRILNANLATGKLSDPAPLTMTFPYENWQYVLPFTGRE